MSGLSENCGTCERRMNKYSTMTQFLPKDRRIEQASKTNLLSWTILDEKFQSI